MREILQDLQYGLRTLRKSPAFTAVAVVTLAFGIGANTAIFSIIDTALIRPLPYQEPDRLLRLYETESAPGHYPFAGPDFIDWRAQNKTLHGMSLLGWPHSMNLNSGGHPDNVRGVTTDANFFQVLGVQPLLGRTWIKGEDQPGHDHQVVLSYGLWKSHFAGDSGVINRILELNSEKYTIIGVMPAAFRYPTRTELWIPQPMDAKTLGPRGNHWASAIGRLKPGVDIRQAQADLSVIAANLERQYPDSNNQIGAAVVSLHDDLIGDARGSFYLMLAAVGLVLLIACANVANLLLSRALARQKEMALRCALGASRSRIVVQLLTESALLGLLGGGSGLLLGWGIIEAFSRSTSALLPRFNAIQLNGGVLAFTLVLALATGLLFGLVPALQASRPDLNEELKGGAGSAVSPGRRQRFTGRALVVGEIALSLLLLVCAGLLLADFVRLRNLNIGVRPQGVWTGGVGLTGSGYKTEGQQFTFARNLLGRARQIPGVDGAAITNRIPPEGGGNYYVTIRGQSSRSRSSQLVERHVVSPEYFQVMGIQLHHGRLFSPADEQLVARLSEQVNSLFKDGARPAPGITNAIAFPTIINDAMARHFWPGRSAIGEMFSNGGENGPWRQVVGVVNDVHDRGLLQAAAPEAYDIFSGDDGFFLVAHTALPPESLGTAMRRALSESDPSLPFFSVRTMDEVIAENAGRQQFLSVLVASFAGLALLLAAVGIYGVLSYAVTQRTREIGIRMSLGASRSRVLTEILAQGAALAAGGIAIGLGGAYAAGRVMANLLHQVQPGDPAILIGTSLFLGLVSLLACYLPARRAARLDPLIALRYE